MFYVSYDVKKRTSLSICKRLTAEGLASEIGRKSELSVGAQSRCENASVASRIGGKFVGRVTTGLLFTTASQNASMKILSTCILKPIVHRRSSSADQQDFSLLAAFIKQPRMAKPT